MNMNRPKFNNGDKVVVIKTHLSSNFPYGKRLTVTNNVKLPLTKNFAIELDNKYLLNEEHLELEEIFESTLYKALKEEE